MSDGATVNERKVRLAHVLRIGGATDASKTSITRALAERHGWPGYEYDHLIHPEPPGHWARVDPTKHPHVFAALVQSLDASWVLTTPEEMVGRWCRTTAERFPMALEDLLAMPANLPIIAEGYGFLPALITPLLTSRRQGVWLALTDAFQRLTFEARVQRGEQGGLWPRMSDPARARANYIRRDLLTGELLKAQARAFGFTQYVVDGARSLADLTALVEDQLTASLKNGGGHGPCPTALSRIGRVWSH